MPAFGGNVDQQYFQFDQSELYLVSTIDEILAVEPSQTEYLFFMTPDTGAGCGIAVDEYSRKFAELVDGTRTVAQIADAMVSDRATTDKGRALAPRIYETLRRAGLFDRPRFLTEYEEGTIAWQSCFPEVYRAYH